jgi:hypothetical protein
MNRPSSPLRMLAKIYANDLITRVQYVEIRAQLLKRLETKGVVTENDLHNFTALTGDDDDVSTQPRSYTSSDWLIISLGLAASAVLAFVLYG